MAIWQSQKEYSSETPRTKEAVSYLDREIGADALYRMFAEYFEANPEGEQVTLFVLKEIGYEKVKAMAQAKAKLKGAATQAMINLVKQHIGLWVAIGLARCYGPESILTYRATANGPGSTRKASDSWKPELHWVTAYTPHRRIYSKTTS